MSGELWIGAVMLVPLAAAALLLWRGARPAIVRVAPWSALPALLLAVHAPSLSVDASWLLLGSHFVLDETGRVFLWFTSILWMASGLYGAAYLSADARRPRFLAFLLVTMAGNLGVILAGDAVAFYLCFAVMSFASYGLIVHTGAPDALLAGRVYMALVVVGELLIFTGIIGAASIAGGTELGGMPALVAASPWGGLVFGLLLIGFGIKAGAVPLHVWLPLAHPVAPTPASAILSGALIKAGLLGWMRFLPLGEAALPAWGGWCIFAGLAAAFGGVLVGVVQSNPKTVLAYSSISQMGFLTVGVGAGLLAPDVWPILLPAVLLYATHHALAKGALFLSTGVVAASAPGPASHRRVIMAGVLLPALAVAGAPLTSGAMGKGALKSALELTGFQTPVVGLDMWLAFAAAGTTALMVRFLVVVARPAAAAPAPPTIALWGPWAAVVALSTLLVWSAPFGTFRRAAEDMWDAAYVWSALWPLMLGALVAWLAWSRVPAARWAERFEVPPGDVLWPLARAGGRAVDAAARAAEKWQGRPSSRRLQRPWPVEWLSECARWERRLAAWRVVGLLLLGIAVTLLAVMG